MKDYNLKQYKVSYFGKDKYTKITDNKGYYIVYKIPYRNLKQKGFVKISNQFIVYILCGKAKNSEKKIVYVGKSKNGIDNRPTSHEKGNNWDVCYILTTQAEPTFLNDGVIQYLENEINIKLNSLTENYVNHTKVTSSNTANHEDKIMSAEFLDEIYNMLDVLGLTLWNLEQVNLFSGDMPVSILQTKVSQEDTFKEIMGYYLRGHYHKFNTWRQMIVDICNEAIAEYGRSTFGIMMEEKIFFKSREQFLRHKPEDEVENRYAMLSNKTYVYVNFDKYQAHNRILKLGEVFKEILLKIEYRDK